MSVIATTDGRKTTGQLEIPEKSSVPSMDKMVWTHPLLLTVNFTFQFCFDIKQQKKSAGLKTTK